MKFAEKLVSQLTGVTEGPVLYDVKGEAAKGIATFLRTKLYRRNLDGIRGVGSCFYRQQCIPQVSEATTPSSI